jgi:hypothetical protein
MTSGTVPKSVGKRPQPKGGSRKGVPNKVTGDLRGMVLNALDEVGGADYLVKQAKKRNPAAFMALVGKCLPKEVKLEAKLTLTDLLRQAEERRAKRAAGG